MSNRHKKARDAKRKASFRKHNHKEPQEAAPSITYRKPEKRPWTKFIDVTHTISSPLTRKLGFTLQENIVAMTGSKYGRVFENSVYRVIKRPMAYKRSSGETATIYQLSIRHVDNLHCHDWRHFQRIKNELCGPEFEAVELYPAESRLVDTANQYYIWVLPEGERCPFGFQMRTVMEKGIDGSRQRPFPKDARPTDLTEPDNAETVAYLENIRQRYREEEEEEKQRVRDQEANSESAGVCSEAGVDDAGAATVSGDGGPESVAANQGYASEDGKNSGSTGQNGQEDSRAHASDCCQIREPTAAVTGHDRTW